MNAWRIVPVVVLLGLTMSTPMVLAAPSAAEAAASATPPAPALQFSVNEGRNINEFYQSGPVAAHLVLRSGTSPRILVAFPAGNSAVGLWFNTLAQGAEWSVQAKPRPIAIRDGRARELRGIEMEVRMAAPMLEVRQAVLSSARVLRDFEAGHAVPEGVDAAPVVEGSTLRWMRDRLDGAAGYALVATITRGSLDGHRLRADAEGVIALRIQAATGETPLRPFAEPELLSDAAKDDIGARHALDFLAYREKLLAGSWRFNTYFGRDTLISVRLLMPALTPAGVEAGLGAVLARTSEQGEVAHEEDIGEFAVLDHRAAGSGLSDEPVFNYHMVDGDYLLSPVLAAWLLDDPRGRARAREFLRTVDGRPVAPRTYGDDLVRNLRLVLNAARAFADDPRASHLIQLKPGMDAGNWRDSGDGLGGGRYPYDVNAVLVPAALEAAQRLLATGLLDPYLRAGDRELFSRSAAFRAVWARRAPPLFAVRIARAQVRAAQRDYLQSLSLPASLISADAGRQDVRFNALSLDAAGRPIPIEHSDEGFALMFGKPAAADLETLTGLLQRFPGGLMTDAGMVVANPVYAAPALQGKFGRTAYHGTVIWSWQQALMAAGIDRQLRRADLPASSRKQLKQARGALWAAINRMQAMRNSELWSWNWAGNRFEPVAFGAGSGDVDESNAVQLWSTVYLSWKSQPAN